MSTTGRKKKLNSGSYAYNRKKGDTVDNMSQSGEIPSTRLKGIPNTGSHATLLKFKKRIDGMTIFFILF